LLYCVVFCFAVELSMISIQAILVKCNQNISNVIDHVNSQARATNAMGLGEFSNTSNLSLITILSYYGQVARPVPITHL